jgi:hypothetical protein
LSKHRAAPHPWNPATAQPVGGTRFLLFPVYAEGMAPETVTLPLRPGSIGPGPSDPYLSVADAADKTAPYDPPAYAPPYRGALLPPALPDAAGHFDHIPFGTPQFLAAHLYGSVRHTLEIWQHYLGRRIVWASADEYPQMELIPLLDWNNAQSGPGFLEAGLWRGPGGAMQPFALDFDVVAHETGHQILFSVIGVPDADEVGVPFLAFHEAFSDLVAIIGVMHFPSVLPRLLEETEGNLYVLNLVNRFAETSATTQIRLASNTATMADVAGITLAPDGTWIDPTGEGRNQHAIAAPLEGAIFDCLVEIYQETLVAERLLPEESDARGWTRAEVEAAFDTLHLTSARAFRQFDAGFIAAIKRARDQVGHALAHVMLSVRPERLSFAEVAARFIEGLLEQGNGAILPALLDYFLWRGIDPRPFLRFVPLAAPGRRRAELFRVQAQPHRPGCTHCRPGATLRAARLIRAGHAAARARMADADGKLATV